MPASGIIFSGNDVKTLKSNIDINGNAKILSGNTDPTSVATSAPKGSIYLNTSTGFHYRKLDSGSSTNWIIQGSVNSSDILTTSFTAADNQSSAANVTGLVFANASVTGFESLLTIVRASTYASYKLVGIQKASSWEMSQDFVGDDTGLVFSITNTGQVQYTSSSTGNTALIKFRAITN